MEKKRNFYNLARRIEKLGQSSSRIKISVPEKIRHDQEEYPLYVLYISQNKKPFQYVKKNICLSAGIHGDEPGGVEAILSVIESKAFQDLYLQSFDFIVFPCINPSGYEYHQRENLSGIDLNRQFNHCSPPREVLFVKEIIHSIPFRLHIDFHEDIDTPGFYLYETVQSGTPRWGEKIIKAVSKQYPINLREQIEGLFAKNGVIGRDEQTPSPNFQEILQKTPGWPLAFYFFSKGTSHSLTFETPVHLTIKERVDIHSTAFYTALESLKR
ncbi:MAG: M14 family metallocarboxypeptidase [Nitrospirae bacterium]|nr:M14 family metallocarboxypeptidase [Nitrospirota bacterium]MBI3351438.1 M14 family metallocarboxypeptidase [Nitrospirota bacterium]